MSTTPQDAPDDEELFFQECLVRASELLKEDKFKEAKNELGKYVSYILQLTRFTEALSKARGDKVTVTIDKDVAERLKSICLLIDPNSLDSGPPTAT